MQERPQNFDEVGGESEVTLASPRFDADEARRANPVVPLEEIPVRRARFRAGARRWPLSLIAVALLSAVALGGILALRRAHTTPPAHVSADAAQEQQPPQTETRADTTPAQTVAAPAQAVTTPAQSGASAQPPSAPAPTAAAVEKSGEEKSAGEEKSETRAPLRAREGRASQARRGEEALPPPAAERAERRDSDGEDGGRGEHRGRFKGGDGRDEERGDVDLKRASKHQKGGARLVDVLVGRPRP